MRTSRYIYLCDQVTEFLQHLLDVDAPTTLLVVCSTRDTFLEQLYDAVWSHAQETAGKHRLLTKSIGLLSNSSRVKLAFCPTLEHLRAYISVLSSPYDVEKSSTNEHRNIQKPLLAVLNILAVHIPTSEFSAQGLSRTLATAVEVSARERMDLVLCECNHATEHGEVEHGEALWYVDIPLLNGSTRMSGGEGTWGGRGVPVRRVAERWFKFDGSNRTITESPDI